MEDEQNGEDIRCESGIEDETPNYLALYVVADEEFCDELEGHEQNNPKQVKLGENRMTEVRAPLSEYRDVTIGSRTIHPKMPNRVKPPNDGHNDKSRIQAKDTQRVNQSVLQC